MTQLRVLKTLGLAQLQDGGRFGCRHLGVTQGGALDWLAAGQANRLLGNAANATVVEIPYGGLSMLVEEGGSLALCGADLASTLDGEPVDNNSSFIVRAGQQLDCHTPRLGVRGYLAAADGFTAPSILGASATVSREALGGLHGDGRPLQANDRLQAGSRQVSASQLSVGDYFALDTPARLALLFAAEYAGFSGRSLFDLTNQPWQVDPRADRMGMRLQGPRLDYQGPGLISSERPQSD
ncbi:MAG: biotin-dependent carboxyltransferase family protein [Pseudomonadaceae bacterium]|nr:MAG: biotin-dependent carboxyltransferase family protein [Pseudomonadaceae bacterium]